MTGAGGNGPMEDSPLRAKVINAILWLSSGTIVIQIISWVSTVAVIRMLTPDDYGLYAMAMPVIFFLQMISSWGFWIALIQHRDLGEEEIRQMAGFIILVFGGAFLVISLAAPAVAHFFREDRLTGLLRLLSASFLFMSLYLIPDSLLFRDMNFKTKTQADISCRLVASIVAPFCAYHSLGVWSLAISEVSLHLTRAIHLNLVSPKFHRPSFRFDRCGKLIRFGLMVTGSNLFVYIFNQADKIIVGRSLGKNLLGIYAVAFNLALLPKEKILPIVTQLSFSAYSRIQDDQERINANLLRTIEAVSFAAFPLFWGMASVAGKAIPFVLGEHWAWAVRPFELLCIVIPLLSISPLYPSALNAIGKPGTVFANSVIEAVIIVAGLLAGVSYGLKGVCMAWLCFYPIAFLIVSQRSLKALGMSLAELSVRLRFPVLASFAMSLAVLAIGYALKGAVGTVPLVSLATLSGAFLFGVLVLVFKRERILRLRDAYLAARGGPEA